MRHANHDPALADAHAVWVHFLNEGITVLGAGNAAAALAPLSQAIAIAARFHPLFHFVESSLHTRRAVMRANAGDVAGAAEDITRALFLDHINAPMLQAKKQLDAGEEIKVDAAAYDSAPRNLGEWLGHECGEASMFDVIDAANSEEAFAHAVTLVDKTHREYHKLAALPWLWRARAHAALGEADLAKNDWRHGWDLDPAIPKLALEKAYY